MCLPLDEALGLEPVDEARAARYSGYEEKTDREIPVVRLRPVELAGTESR
jgi:hypothetical protein